MNILDKFIRKISILYNFSFNKENRCPFCYNIFEKNKYFDYSFHCTECGYELDNYYFLYEKRETFFLQNDDICSKNEMKKLMLGIFNENIKNIQKIIIITSSNVITIKCHLYDSDGSYSVISILPPTKINDLPEQYKNITPEIAKNILNKFKRTLIMR